jgi:hypothetical protein
MALRVLSGVILPAAGFRSNGDATIDFVGHAITGNVDACPRDKMHQMGPSVAFNGEPCVIVALRRVRFNDQDHSRPSEAHNDQKDLNVDHSLDGTQRMRVHWKTDGAGAEIREISYMVVGDA